MSGGERTQEILQTRSLFSSGRGQVRLSPSITLYPLRVNPHFMTIDPQSRVCLRQSET